MTKKDKTYLVECLTHMCASLGAIISIFEETDTHPKLISEPPLIEAETVDSPHSPPTRPVSAKPEQAAFPANPPEPTKPVTYEMAREALSTKARIGYRAEVKALLSAHGVRQLSDITDPAIYAQLMEEAEGIGDG